MTEPDDVPEAEMPEIDIAVVSITDDGEKVVVNYDAPGGYGYDSARVIGMLVQGLALELYNSLVAEDDEGEDDDEDE